MNPQPVEARVRKRLPHTWHAFFGRFGRLTPIQGQVAAPIVGGEPVMAIAPTASGKTEAVLAPLLERVYGPELGWEGLRVLVISPTRALCNDLMRRLRQPVERCRLRIEVKSGDSSHFNAQNPPDILITTPESLDSMLCRRPKALRSVCAIMIDELHLLASAPRGDQLQCLLARLSKVATEAVQICAASATVPNAQAVASAFLGPEARIEAATRGPGGRKQRQIEAELDEVEALTAAAAAIEARFIAKPGQKLLVFANSRTQVETLAAEMGKNQQLAGRVYAHHGSLSRAERLRSERGFLDAPSAVCVATLTLEIGVDIGDVDQVILLAPPPNVASLLQRVGRGNRRGDLTRVWCLYSGDFERLRFEHLLECARNGDFFADTVPFRPSVVAQQALSLLFQNPARWVSARALHARLPASGLSRLAVEDCGAILTQMTADGWLREDSKGRLLAEDKAVKAYEAGRMHVNFHVENDLQVVDATTGRAVGRIRLDSGARGRLKRGESLSVSLGGQRRQVTSLSSHRITVRSGSGKAGEQAGGFISREAPRYSFGLAQSLAHFLGLPPNTILVDHSDDKWHLVHFWGSIWGRLLEGVLRASKGRRIHLRPHPFITPMMPGLLPSEGQGLGTPAEIRLWAQMAIEGDLMGFAKMLEPGPMLSSVPAPIVLRWVTEAMDFDRFVPLAANVRVVKGPWQALVQAKHGQSEPEEENADVDL